MYGGIGFKQGIIGDVDVLRVGETFHLFHLVLPNHSYIAHAVSDDGLSWEAVPHALHISNPGHFDDDMLWTMHVTPDPDLAADPENGGPWRMFYTGLSREDAGRVQRVGLATSDDLIHWNKVFDSADDPGSTTAGGNACDYPLEVPGPPYEKGRLDTRRWTSFRDPYFYHDCPRNSDGNLSDCTGERLLLACGRVDHGPDIRRGCVLTARETERNRFEFIEPLHHPGLYDEIEVPGVFRLDGRYFLLGSIREDVKVRYWYSDTLMGPYENYFDNVLLPQGNYAARPGYGRDGFLLWNFFYRDQVGGPSQHLPPPKSLVKADDGRLKLKSFYGFDGRVLDTFDEDDLTPLEPLRGTGVAADGWLGCGIGFEAFRLKGEYTDLRLRLTLDMDGPGKVGLVLRLDDRGNGYYFSLDLLKGLAQVRGWGERQPAPDPCGPSSPDNRAAAAQLPSERAFCFEPLQSAHFISKRDGPWNLELVAFGRYLELSVDGYIALTLSDDRYTTGRAGVYVEGARTRLTNLTLQPLRGPGAASPLPKG